MVGPSEGESDHHCNAGPSKGWLYCTSCHCTSQFIPLLNIIRDLLFDRLHVPTNESTDME